MMLTCRCSCKCLRCYRLPDENTANELFNGIPYFETHICVVKTSKNNTIMRLYEPTGKGMTPIVFPEQNLMLC